MNRITQDRYISFSNENRECSRQIVTLIINWIRIQLSGFNRVLINETSVTEKSNIIILIGMKISLRIENPKKRWHKINKFAESEQFGTQLGEVRGLFKIKIVRFGEEILLRFSSLRTRYSFLLLLIQYYYVYFKFLLRIYLPISCNVNYVIRNIIRLS